MEKEISLVGKIGSMALIRRGDSDIDYNIFSRIGAELRPGMVWVSSGAVEIGASTTSSARGGSSAAMRTRSRRTTRLRGRRS